MEAQIVELSEEQLAAILAAVQDVGTGQVYAIVIMGVFLAFEIAAISFWRSVFRE